MTFKQHLLNLNESEKEWEYMLDFMVPVKPGYFDFQETTTVYRIAGIQSPSDMKKREGKKGIYTGFTKGSTGVSRGIFSGSKYLWELEGKVQFDSEHDFYTRLDRNGYRWFKSEFFEKKMEVKVKEYFKKRNLEGYSWSFYNEYLDKENPKIRGERKRDFIKWYYDESKKLIKKYNKEIIQEVKEKHKNPTAGYDNDEVLFNEYKIIGAYITTAFKEKETFTSGVDTWSIINEPEPFKQQVDNLKKNNIKNLGFIYLSDIIKIDKDKGKTPNKYKFNISLEKLTKEIEKDMQKNFG
jgi:hypothetical protein